MDRDLDALVAQLELDEKAALLAGADMWSTVAVERLGIPSVRVTDGPNGARGPTLPGRFADGLVAHLGVRARRVPRSAPAGTSSCSSGSGGRSAEGAAHVGVPRPAGADGQPPPLAAGRPQLRVLLRGPAAGRPHRRRVRPRRAGRGRRLHGQALRRQRVRDRPHDRRLA